MSNRLPVVVLIAFFALLLLGPELVQLGVDWPWFSALGFERVFVTRLVMQAVLLLGVGGLAFGFLYGNLRLAQRGVVPEPILFRIDSGTRVLDLTGLLRRLALPASLAVAFLIGLGATAGWLPLLQYLNRKPFGVSDPVFGHDVGYYVFTLPVVTAVLALVVGVTVVTLIAVLMLYVLRRDLVLRGRRMTVEPSARRHVGALVAILFFAAALQTWFVRLPALMLSPGGTLFGANFADLHARLPALRLAAVVAAAGGAYVLWGTRTQRLARSAVAAGAAYFGVLLLGVGIYPGLVQRLIVAPNELAKETPQLRFHIDATRRAWGLDSVVTRDLSGEAHLTLRDIQANQPTIENVRLWDRDPLLQTFGQLQEIRTYYDFVSVDDDRYWIDGTYRQVLLSARELNVSSLPTRTFINERLTFTHGMGLTLGPVNQVTDEGLPVLFIKDLPPVSTVSLHVTRPEIYFGELDDHWVFTDTKQREFDYPSGDENIFTTYDGKGGVPVHSWLRRLLLAAQFRSLKALLSSDITDTSRALFYRNIRTRAGRVLPFLAFDGDPYLVVTEAGRLKWILDAYTFTTRYPYAQPMRGGVNYLRNSVKVVIDAYDGTVSAYLAEPTDPIVQAYSAAFPGIFQPLSAMPADLRSHLRYPEDLFREQTDLYAVYHMAEPEIFYHREDQWQKPVVARGVEQQDPFLRHIVMRLPEENRPEFLFMVPFTPRGKDNLAAWMVARNDGDHYGQLLVYRFPKQSLVFGPTQIVNRINQDTEIARQISLWDQRGSEVIRGHLLVIPIEESLIYVQPLYLRAEGGRIPELKRVVVAHQNRVVMAETLELGLAELFGGAVERPARPVVAGGAASAPPSSIEQLIQQAGDHYQRALAAQRTGDWARYGEEIRQLGEVLRDLRDAQGRSQH